MNYKQYDRYVFTQKNLDRYLEEFNKDIEEQKQQILEFEKRAKERITLVNNWEQQKNFIIFERYEFDKVADMRKKMLELEEKYSCADWSKFEKEIE